MKNSLIFIALLGAVDAFYPVVWGGRGSVAHYSNAPSTSNDLGTLDEATLSFTNKLGESALPAFEAARKSLDEIRIDKLSLSVSSAVEPQLGQVKVMLWLSTVENTTVGEQTLDDAKRVLDSIDLQAIQTSLTSKIQPLFAKAQAQILAIDGSSPLETSSSQTPSAPTTDQYMQSLKLANGSAGDARRVQLATGSPSIPSSTTSTGTTTKDQERALQDVLVYAHQAMNVTPKMVESVMTIIKSYITSFHQQLDILQTVLVSQEAALSASSSIAEPQSSMQSYTDSLQPKSVTQNSGTDGVAAVNAETLLQIRGQVELIDLKAMNASIAAAIYSPILSARAEIETAGTETARILAPKDDATTTPVSTTSVNDVTPQQQETSEKVVYKNGILQGGQSIDDAAASQPSVVYKNGLLQSQQIVGDTASQPSVSSSSSAQQSSVAPAAASQQQSVASSSATQQPSVASAAASQQMAASSSGTQQPSVAAAVESQQQSVASSSGAQQPSVATAAAASQEQSVASSSGAQQPPVATAAASQQQAAATAPSQQQSVASSSGAQQPSVATAAAASQQQAAATAPSQKQSVTSSSGTQQPPVAAAATASQQQATVSSSDTQQPSVAPAAASQQSVAKSGGARQLLTNDATPASQQSVASGSGGCSCLAADDVLPRRHSATDGGILFGWAQSPSESIKSADR